MLYATCTWKKWITHLKNHFLYILKQFAWLWPSLLFTPHVGNIFKYLTYLTTSTRTQPPPFYCPAQSSNWAVLSTHNWWSVINTKIQFIINIKIQFQIDIKIQSDKQLSLILISRRREVTELASSDFRQCESIEQKPKSFQSSLIRLRT